MIRYACNPPAQNASTIVDEGFEKLGLSPLGTPASHFGIQVDVEMVVIPGRELPPPRLSYSSGQPQVRNGGWNILDVKFHQGAKVRSWWVLAVKDGATDLSGPNDGRIRGLITAFINKMRRSGMDAPTDLPRLISVNLPPPGQDPGRNQALGMIQKVMEDTLAAAGSKPSFVLVLLGDSKTEKRDDYIYAGVKVW
jgi:eukaryotic translation initiation factor 2C